METVIYYFTGTGNSLWAARELARGLPDCAVQPMAPLVRDGGRVRPEAPKVGIACPVYFFGLPSLVARFAGMLDTSGTRYLFAVVTMGGMGGNTTLRQLDRILARSGKGLDAGIAVRMPGNYLVGYSPPPAARQAAQFSRAKSTLLEFADTVRVEKRRKPGFSPFTGLIHALMYPRFLRSLPDADRAFTVSDACTSCDTCRKVCPVENITLEAGRPVWHHRCELCLACIQHCPVDAIQRGEKTVGRARYRHPSIPLAELERQQTGGVPEPPSPGRSS